MSGFGIVIQSEIIVEEIRLLVKEATTELDKLEHQLKLVQDENTRLRLETAELRKSKLLRASAHKHKSVHWRSSNLAL